VRYCGAGAILKRQAAAASTSPVQGLSGSVFRCENRIRIHTDAVYPITDNSLDSHPDTDIGLRNRIITWTISVSEYDFQTRLYSYKSARPHTWGKRKTPFRLLLSAKWTPSTT